MTVAVQAVRKDAAAVAVIAGVSVVEVGMSAAADKTSVLVAAVGMGLDVAEKNRMPVVELLAGVVAVVAVVSVVFGIAVVVIAVMIAVVISEIDEKELEVMVVVAGSKMVVHWEGSLAGVVVVVDVDFGEGIANTES